MGRRFRSSKGIMRRLKARDEPTLERKDGACDARALRMAQLGSIREVSQNRGPERFRAVNASNEAMMEIDFGETRSSLEAIFEAEYQNIVRAIATVTQDPGRAEELAVDVFLKWSHRPSAHGPYAKAWLYRAAVRIALDEMRRVARTRRRDSMLPAGKAPPDPESLLCAKRTSESVREILGAIAERQAQLVLLRSYGLDYAEIAAALGLKAVSVGTLLKRAEEAFRKEYIKRYGEQ